jgi:recombination protein RecA
MVKISTKKTESASHGILKIKEAIFGSADPIQIDAFDFIPTGIPVLDKKLGGGIIVGGVIELMGLESSGKSTLAGMIAAQAQAKEIPVVYLDTETATSMARLKMLGVDTESLIYYQPYCLEEVYDTIASILTSKLKDKTWLGPVLIVWDSLAQTPAKKEVEMEEGEEYTKEMAIRARVNSMGLRKLTKPLQNAQVSLLIINQFRENVGQTFGEKYSTPGGHAPKYASIQRIRLSATNTVDIDKEAKITGKLIVAKTIKNKAYTPLLEAILIFNHKTGTFDIPLSAFENLKKEKRITSSGKTWVLNLNSDISDDNEENVISFQRKEWESVYQANLSKINEIIE